MSGIVINEDCNHYFCNRGIAGADEATMRILSQHYCIGQTTEVVYNLNGMVSSVGGLPFEPIWENVVFEKDGNITSYGRQISPVERDMILGMKTAWEKGLDSYKIWLDETRRLGRRASLSIRMNDVHCVNDPTSFHSRFWRQHPEYRRESLDLPHFWPSGALDFSHQEVRDYTLQMVLAVIDAYDMDGLELDWMRFGQMFRPGYEDQGRALLTEFHREVRNALRRRETVLGHPIALSVRCPTQPQEAYDAGFDVIEWARQGLIDRVVPSPFFNSTDFEIPISFWRELLPTTVGLDAGLEICIQPDPWSDPIMETPDTLCAQAANYLSQGADRIYLFNHMDSDTTLPNDYAELFHCVGSLSTAAAHTRRHLVSRADFVSCGSPVKPRIPMECWNDRVSDYLRMDIGPAPEPGRNAVLILGIGDDRQDIVPVLNNEKLTLLRSLVNEEKKRSDYVMFEYSSQQEYPLSCKKLLYFDATRAIKAGRNCLYVEKNSRGGKITWAEIRIEAVRNAETKQAPR